MGSKLLNKPGYGRHDFSGITQTPTNSRCVKDWAAILRIVFLGLAPKCHPDFILSAFSILSLIKNEAKVCFDMLPCCCRSVHVAKLGGWVAVKNYLGVSDSVLVRLLCAGGTS